MASAQVVETSVNTNNSPSQDYTTNPDDHSNHNVSYPHIIYAVYSIQTIPRYTLWKIQLNNCLPFQDYVYPLKQFLLNIIVNA